MVRDGRELAEAGGGRGALGRGARIGFALLALVETSCSDGTEPPERTEAVGHASNELTVPSAFPTTPWRYYGEKQGQHLGEFITGVGDVNGDGYDDLALGTQEYDPPGEDAYADWGRVQIFFGSANGLPSVPSQTLSGTQDADRRAKTLRGGALGRQELDEIPLHSQTAGKSDPEHEQRAANRQDPFPMPQREQRIGRERTLEPATSCGRSFPTRRAAHGYAPTGTGSDVPRGGAGRSNERYASSVRLTAAAGSSGAS